MDPFASLITPPRAPVIGRLAVSHSTHIDAPRKRRTPPSKRDAQAEIRAAKELAKRKASVIARLAKIAERLPEGAHLIAQLEKDLKRL